MENKFSRSISKKLSSNKWKNSVNHMRNRDFNHDYNDGIHTWIHEFQPRDIKWTYCVTYNVELCEVNVTIKVEDFQRGDSRDANVRFDFRNLGDKGNAKLVEDRIGSIFENLHGCV
jgi:hypothetical protein